jgi:hypothetical protein
LNLQQNSLVWRGRKQISNKMHMLMLERKHLMLERMQVLEFR